MTSFSKITNGTDSHQAFWINNSGKPLLMKPLKARAIVELFQAIRVY